MLVFMSEIRCPSCGFSFETQAVTNTRCRRCRKVVRVGRSQAQLWELGLLLACGHASWYFDWEKRPSAAVEYLFTCEECGAKEQEVLRLLGAVAAEDMDNLDGDKLFVSLFAENASSVK